MISIEAKRVDFIIQMYQLVIRYHVSLNMNLIEIIGYSASALLIVSFMLRDITNLRLVNTLGCAFFVAYGFMLGNNWPIIIPNVFIMGVNLYHLIRSENQGLAEN